MKKRVTYVLSASLFALVLSLAVPLCHQPLTAQAASKVKISKKKLTLRIGQKKKLKLKGVKKSKLKKVKWSSSNKKVATVTKNGKVKAKKAGKATITAKYRGKKYKCRVTVRNSKRTVVRANANTQKTAGEYTVNPIWEGADLGLCTVDCVWYQAVPMSGGYEDIGDNNIHIEADISANENTLGFRKGDWIPYLQVSFDITDASTGDPLVSGKLMPMSASNGPHYGANVHLDAGTYNFTVSISPQVDVYLIHLDSETGPGGNWDDYFKDGALTYTCRNWEF